MLLLLGILSVHAASFDCAKATTSNEKVICSDESLSSLDETLFESYTDARNGESKENLTVLQSAQSEWLKIRDKLCTISSDQLDEPESRKRTIRCLNVVYQRQIDLLDDGSYTLAQAEECSECRTTLDYGSFKQMKLQLSKFRSLSIIASWAHKLEASHGDGSAAPGVDAWLKELDAVSRRSKEACEPLRSGGTMGRYLNYPGCQTAMQDAYNEHLERILSESWLTE